jgi:hypothetical protein
VPSDAVLYRVYREAIARRQAISVHHHQHHHRREERLDIDVSRFFASSH